MKHFPLPYIDNIISPVKKIIVHNLVAKSYYSYKFYYLYHLHRMGLTDLWQKTPPILIYQMGKVGSSTISRSLRSLNLGIQIYHIHYLAEDRISKKLAKCKKYFHSEGSISNDAQNQWRNQLLRKQIKRGLNGKKWKIVSLVRDPIARNISNFFHHMDQVEFLPDCNSYKIKSYKFNFEITIKLEDIEPLSRLFFEKVNHESPLTFFDRELKKIFGIDIFASNFPKTKGYEIYYGKQAEVLLIKLDNLRACAHTAFKEFLNLDNFNLLNVNIGSNKSYAPIYDVFKNAVIIPDYYIDKIYNSKYTLHFYSREEIEKFKNKWQSFENPSQ